jgi:hypothetical protein
MRFIVLFYFSRARARVQVLLESKAAAGQEVLVQPDQCGSEVLPEKFRFDFAWNEGVAVPELAAIEREVRAVIATKLPVYVARVLFVGWFFL